MKEIDKAKQILEIYQNINSDFLSEFQKQFELLKENIAIKDIINSVTPIIQQIDLSEFKTNIGITRETFKALSDSLLSLYNNEKIINIAEQFKETVKLISDSFLQNIKQEAFNNKEYIEKFKKIEEKYIVVMLESDWFPILDFDISVLKDIVEEYETTDYKKFKEELDNEIINYFNDKKILQIYSKWEKLPFLQDRMHILKDIIDSHINKKYNLSIPVMLAQIEGVLAKFYKHRGQMKYNILKNYLNKTFEVSYNDFIINKLLDYIYENIYEKFEWGDDIDSSISRHAIIHGACLNYGNVYNSLKTILFFNFIIQELDFLQYMKEKDVKD